MTKDLPWSSLSALACTLLLAFPLSACAPVPKEKSINIQAITSNIEHKNPNNKAFQDYLLQMGYQAADIPFKQWGIDELTLCAAFFHPALDVAKAEYQLARIQTLKAGLKNSPELNGTLARSNQKNGDIRPWAYGLTISLPIVTNNKRALKIEKAKHNAEQSKMQLAAKLWQLRQQIAYDYLQYQMHLRTTALLSEQIDQQERIVSMLQKRVDAGIAANTELSQAQLQAVKIQHLLNQKTGEAAILKAKLAADVGITALQFSSLKLKKVDIETLIHKQSQLMNEATQGNSLQKDALLNRIDIRQSLARYAAAETEIKLRAAQQIPDITLSPGFIFEFGDSVWSLGITSLLQTLSQHDVLMDEAKQLRAVEGAKFEQLQSNIIAQLEQSLINYQSAKTTLENSRQQLAQQMRHTLKMQKQFDAGFIDRIELLRFKHNEIVAKQTLLDAAFNFLTATNRVEDVLQKPLFNTFKMPEVSNE